MTHVAGRSRRGIPKAWILPVVALVLILALTAIGVFSRSIVIDLAAWWPVWLLLVIATFLARGRSWGRVRLGGLVAVLGVILLGLFVTGHILGWQAMPSASPQLVGPSPNAASTVALSARVQGKLDVHAVDTGFLYTVGPVRWGGEVGPPEAVEQVQGTNLTVRLDQVDDPGPYTFAGWDVALHQGPTWNLSLGGRIDGELSQLRLIGLQLDGEGRVSLGTAAESVVVNVSGEFTISIPTGAPVRVVGEADVPADWVETGQGFESPAPGDGWVISVAEGALLTVTGR